MLAHVAGLPTPERLAAVFKYVVLVSLAFTLALSGALGLIRDGGQSAASTVLGAAPEALLPSSVDPAAAVASLEAEVRRVPDDHVAWADLGLAYFELAGGDLDPDLFAKADDAIERSLEISPTDNVRALGNRAAISASHHEFGAALEQADETLAIAPYDGTALAIRIDSLTQLGRFDELMPAVRTADRRQPGVPVASRWSYAVELDGDLERAKQILLDSTVSARGAELSHALVHVADLDRRQGDLEAAERGLDRAEAAFPRDGDIPVGRALLAQARGDHEQALAIWQDVVSTTPLPEHFLALGELLEHLGRTAEADQAYADSVAAVERLAAGGANIDGELAQYRVDHGDAADLDEALALGRAEAERSRGVHASDAYAWALHANGRHEEALRYSKLATRRNTQEAILWIHRGTIEASLGRTDVARRHLRAAIDMDPGLSPWQLDKAEQVLARLA